MNAPLDYEQRPRDRIIRHAHEHLKRDVLAIVAGLIAGLLFVGLVAWVTS